LGFGSGGVAVLYPADIALVATLLRYLGDFLDEFPIFMRREQHLEMVRFSSLLNAKLLKDLPQCL
jgi:hypothetical protein